MDVYTVSTHYVYNLQNEFVVHTLILSQILFWSQRYNTKVKQYT